MSQASDLERQMQELINEERAALGLDPLQLELNLNEASEDHSLWMLEEDKFSHTGEGGSNPGDRMEDAGFVFSGSWTWGENVAYQSERGQPGYSDDVEDLHDALMNSPGHRANILNPNFDYVGIGIEVGDYNGFEAVMVTQTFAATSAPVQIDTGGGGSDPNSAPKVNIDDLVLTKGKGNKVKLDDHMTVRDKDGDDIVWYELRDTEGRDNFVWRGQGRIDADDPFRVDADDIGSIRISPNKKLGTTTLEVRAYDGEDVGKWESFTLTTVSADDAFILA